MTSAAALGGLVALLHVTSCGAPATTSTPTPTVVLRDIAFRPGTLHVRPGTWVTFSWRDGASPHDVTPVGHRRFRRLGRRQSGFASVRFVRRGTYRYVCTIHPGMAGRVIVR
jgi:plastocyanin